MNLVLCVAQEKPDKCGTAAFRHLRTEKYIHPVKDGSQGFGESVPGSRADDFEVFFHSKSDHLGSDNTL
jgi:hypothetical protein